jgi:hypothetical protein
LARRKIEAAKVAAAEREKKKAQDPVVPVEIDRGLALKKRPLDTVEKVKQLAVKEREPEDAEASAKRARVDPVAETDEDVDIMTTVVWTSLGPLPRWVPGPTTRWAPGTTRLALHGT